MTITQWFQKNSRKYATKQDACAAVVKALNCKPRSALVYFNKGEFKLKDAVVKTSKLSELAKVHDVKSDITEKLWEFLKKMEDDDVVTDTELRISLGVSHHITWGQVRDLEEFSRFQFTMDAKLHWATPKGVDFAVEHIAKARRV